MWNEASILYRVQLVWNQFSLQTGCLTKVKELSLPYYLPITERNTEGFMPLPSVQARSETLTTSFRIWTRVTDSISYDDNRYAKCPSYVSMYVCKCM